MRNEDIGIIGTLISSTGDRFVVKVCLLLAVRYLHSFQREVTKFTDTWNSICKNSLVGTGAVFHRAAIVSHTGNIYSSCPADFLPTIDQIEIIVKAMSKPAQLAKDGINIAEMNYKYSSCLVSGSTAHQFTGDLADGNGGVVIYITKMTILIGVYSGEGQTRKDEALQLMGDIWEWVRDTGF